VSASATATLQLDPSSFLELDTAIVSGGILTNAGTVNSLNGTSELDGVATSTSHLVEVTAGELIIHSGSVANTGTGKLLATSTGTLDLQSVTVTDEAGAPVHADPTSFLELDTAIVSGGILTNAGTVNSLNGTSELDGVATSTSHLVEVTAGELIIHSGSVA